MKKMDKPITRGDLDKALSETFGKFTKFIGEKFEEIHKRFQKMDERFEQMDERFQKMDERFEQIDQRFQQTNDRILTSEDKIMKRLDYLDADNAAGTIQARRLTVRIDNHENRISSLERKN